MNPCGVRTHCTYVRIGATTPRRRDARCATLQHHHMFNVHSSLRRKSPHHFRSPSSIGRPIKPPRPDPWLTYGAHKAVREASNTLTQQPLPPPKCAE